MPLPSAKIRDGKGGGSKEFLGGGAWAVTTDLNKSVDLWRSRVISSSASDSRSDFSTAIFTFFKALSKVSERFFFILKKRNNNDM